MLTRAARLLLALTTSVAACRGAATIASIKNLGALTGAGPRLVTVTFSTKAGLTEAQVIDPNLWRVTVVYPAKNTPSSTVLTVLSDPPPHVIDNDLARINLTVGGTVASNWERVIVEFLGDPVSLQQATQADLKKTAEEQKKEFSAASGKSDADAYLSGLWSPAVSGPTLYTIDSSLAFRLGPRLTPQEWFYFSSAVNTNNTKKSDPNSFRWRTAWRYVPLARLAPTLDIGGGMEFDKTGSVINILASPRATWPLVADCSKFFIPGVDRCHDKPGDAVAFGYEFDLTLGAELGSELKDPLRFSNVNFPGTGAIYRGAPQAKLFLNFRKVPHFKQISMENDYDARFLARPEIFLETRLGTANPVPLITGRTRQHVANTLTLKITDLLGVTFKHELGSLPPAYCYIDHRFTVGFTLQLKENRTLRY